jgi:uncharacterized protein (DUF58 family)
MKVLVGKQAALIGLTLFTFGAAWNRGNNLLYVMFALLGATVILSYLLPRFSLKGISAVRSLPPVAFEDEEIDIRITVRNGGWTRRYMLEVVDRIPAAEPQFQLPMTFIGLIPRKKEREFSFKSTCFKRGEHRVGPLTVQSAYPLGLTTVRKTMPESPATLVVYPRVFEIPSLPILGAAHLPETGVEAIPKAGISEEFFGVREYRHGDSLRRIHWPSSARHSKLIVKEFEIKVKTEISIVLDLHSSSDIGEGRETTLEYAARIAASIARHVIERGHRVQLFAYGKTPVHIPAAAGIGQLGAIYDALARVAADGKIRFPEAVFRASAGISDGSTAFLLSADKGNLSSDDLQGLGLLRMKRVRPVGILFDPASFERPGKKFDARAGGLERELSNEGALIYRVKKGVDLTGLFIR